MIARRRLLAFALVAATLAGSAFAADKVKDPKKVFQYLEAYWKLAPADRSRFALAYVFRHDGKPLAVPMAIVMKGQSYPIPLVDGRTERVPSLAELEDGELHVAIDEKEKITIGIEILALVRPAPEMPVKDLVAVIDQATAGEKKVAGLVGFMAPKLTEVAFEGVPSGEARFADGHKQPLPVKGGLPVFAPAQFPGAVALVFPKAPTRVQVG
jgi:hypothetical protein